VFEQKVTVQSGVNTQVHCGQKVELTSVTARVSPYGICGGQSGTVTGFSPSTSVFPCQVHSTGATLKCKADKTSPSSSQGCTISLNAAVRP
jgi:hypothetical protein